MSVTLDEARSVLANEGFLDRSHEVVLEGREDEGWLYIPHPTLPVILSAILGFTMVNILAEAGFGVDRAAGEKMVEDVYIFPQVHANFDDHSVESFTELVIQARTQFLF